MADRIFRLDRRKLLAGLGATALAPALPVPAVAQGRPGIAVDLAPGSLSLRAGGPDTPIWSLSEFTFRFRQGDMITDLGKYGRGETSISFLATTCRFQRC